MIRYTAAQARQHLSDVLDTAERGQHVIIERRGVRFTLGKARPSPAKRHAWNRPPVLTILHPAVEAGQWTWRMGRKGAELVSTTGKRTR